MPVSDWFPALSVCVAVIVIVLPSVGAANVAVTLPLVISVAVNTRSVFVIPSLTEMTSPATADAGIPIVTSISPANSVPETTRLLSTSSSIVTVGALLGTESISAEAMPLGVVLPEVSVRLADTVKSLPEPGG